MDSSIIDMGYGQIVWKSELPDLVGNRLQVILFLFNEFQKIGIFWYSGP